jgi:hypothetical protein
MTLKAKIWNARARPQIRLGAVIAIAVTVAVVVWLVTRAGGGRPHPVAQQAPAVAVSVTELRELARTLSYPIYWAGPEPSHTYELTRTVAGRVYIRYLPQGIHVGDKRADYLTVATYPQANGFAEIRTAAAAKGNVKFRLAHGGLAVLNPDHPTSVYFAYPGAHYQVEVYAPSATLPRQLVAAGRIVPIHG